MKLFSLLAPFAVTRLALSAGLNPVGQRTYPPEVLPVLRSFFLQTRFLRETARAQTALEESMAQVRASRSALRSFPLVVLSQRLETDFGDQEAAAIWQRLFIPHLLSSSFAERTSLWNRMNSSRARV